MNRITEGSVTVNVYIMFYNLGWTIFDQNQYKIRYESYVYTIWTKGMFIDNADWMTRNPDGCRKAMVGTQEVLDYIGKNLPNEIVVKIHKWLFQQI